MTSTGAMTHELQISLPHIKVFSKHQKDEISMDIQGLVRLRGEEAVAKKGWPERLPKG